MSRNLREGYYCGRIRGRHTREGEFGRDSLYERLRNKHYYKGSQ